MEQEEERYEVLIMGLRDESFPYHHFGIQDKAKVYDTQLFFDKRFVITAMLPPIQQSPLGTTRWLVLV